VVGHAGAAGALAEGALLAAPGAARREALDDLYRIRYIAGMEYVIRQTEAFIEWRAALRDQKAAAAIRRRIERAEAGNLGDVKPVGEGVSEFRVDVGPGYRLYFTVRERVVVFLLVGGDKSMQARDIAKAIALAKEI